MKFFIIIKLKLSVTLLILIKNMIFRLNNNFNNIINQIKATRVINYVENVFRNLDHSPLSKVYANYKISDHLQLFFFLFGM